jgi:hypothetical protein
MAEVIFNLSGGGPQQGYLNVYRESQNAGGNYTVYRIVGSYLARGYGSWANRTQYWSANAGGQAFSGSFVIGSPGTGDINLINTTFVRYHDGNGYGSDFNTTFCIDTDHSAIGDGCGTVYEEVPPRIAQVPPAPVSYAVDQPTATSLRYIYNGQGDGGSPIIRWEYQYALDAWFTVGVSPWITGTGTDIATGLTPSTTYYFRSHGINAVGVGPVSGQTAAGQTLPAVPPGMTVTPSPSGVSATISLTPPGGVSGVSSYWIDWRPVGGAWTAQNGGAVQTVSGLTPGVTYEWKASAIIGGYESPKTAIVPVTQPNPNTNPGDYFDGSTTDKADIDYQWSGTANNSTSIAVGRGVTGWSATFANGATGVLYQVTGGVGGGFAGRVQLKSDATAAGAVSVGIDPASTSRSTVQANTLYAGSMYVNPSRQQRMRARVFWYTAAGALISGSIGEEAVVPAASWTRLTVVGTSPATAAYAVVRVEDVAGTGFSVWQAGNTVSVDAAMLTLSSVFPYFDGATPDTAGYDYQWIGTAHASESRRLDVLTAPADPLADPDCDPVPAPPRPPTIPSDCIEDVGTWRRYWATVPASEVSEWAMSVPTIYIDNGAVATRQVRIRVYPNPFGYPADQLPPDGFCAEQIISYIPPSSTMHLDGVLQRAWTEIQGGPPINADHLLYGTGGTPASWFELSCGIPYLLSFDVPLDAPAGNIAVRLEMTERL